MALWNIFPTNLGWASLIIAGLGTFIAYKFMTTTSSKKKGVFSERNLGVAAAIFLLAFGVIGSGLGTTGLNLGQPLAAGAAPAVTTTTTPITITTTTTPVSTSSSKLKIETFAISTQEKYSNAQDAVGNDTYGFLNVYPADQTPADANANTIARINITSGTASKTVSGLYTGTPYRVAFDGGAHNGWYDRDYGIMSFDNKDFNPNTGTYGMSLTDIARIAVIDDPIGDASTSAYGGVTPTPTTELNNGSAGGLGVNYIVYNETNGDGNFYFELTHSYSGGNREIQNAVECFEWDSTNPPEGNEYTAISASLRSGTNYGIPDDILNYWTSEGCISFGTRKSGANGEYRYTITATEANMENGGDITNIRLDDLSAYRASNVLTANKGQDPQSVYLTSGQ